MTDMNVRRLPDNVHIARGRHAPGDPTADPASTMEWVAWLAGVKWSDHPTCTHPVIAAAVRAVNDGLADGPRQRLADLIPELARAGDHDDPLDLLARQRMSVRLAACAAEQVAYLVPPADRTVCERALAAARSWAATPTGEAQEAARAAAASADRAATYAVPSAAAIRAASGDVAAAADVAGFFSTLAAARAGAAADDLGGLYSACAAARYAGTAAVVACAAEDAIDVLRGLIAEHARLTTG